MLNAWAGAASAGPRGGVEMLRALACDDRLAVCRSPSLLLFALADAGASVSLPLLLKVLLLLPSSFALGMIGAGSARGGSVVGVGGKTGSKYAEAGLDPAAAADVVVSVVVTVCVGGLRRSWS